MSDFFKSSRNNLQNDKQNLIVIPNLRDVELKSAMDLLKDQMGLLPLGTCLKPNAALADELANCVISCEPKFGSKVSPGSIIKVHYVTDDVLSKSVDLKNNNVQKLKIPIVLGASLEEAKHDLEAIGLKVSVKLEKPDWRFANLVAGQTTNMTYTNDKSYGTTYIPGDRVCLWYVDAKVVEESLQKKLMRDKLSKEQVEKMAKIGKDVTHLFAKGIFKTAKTIAKKVGSLNSK